MAWEHTKPYLAGTSVILAFISSVLIWETVGSSNATGRQHAENWNAFVVLFASGLCAAAVFLNVEDGIKAVCQLFATTLTFFLLTGVGVDFYSMPWTSAGGLNMLRKWVALPDGWDQIKDQSPPWSRKLFSASVFAWIGLLLGLIATLEFEAPRDPLNRSRKRQLNAVKLTAGSITIIAGLIGAICLWCTTLAIPPSGDPYLSNGPFYRPTPVDMYREQTYGKYAVGGRGLTEADAYYEVMSSSMVYIFLGLITLAVMTSKQTYGLSCLLLAAGGLYGWNMLGRMFYWRWKTESSISDSDLATLTAGYIFGWFSALGAVTLSAVELMLQTEAPSTSKVGVANHGLPQLKGQHVNSDQQYDPFKTTARA